MLNTLPGYNSPLWNILMLESEVLNFANNSPTQNVFLSLGETVTDEECQQFILDADLDGDGKINYEEFYSMMSMPLTGTNK